jgi:hypothetical protein
MLKDTFGHVFEFTSSGRLQLSLGFYERLRHLRQDHSLRFGNLRGFDATMSSKRCRVPLPLKIKDVVQHFIGESRIFAVALKEGR